MTTYKRILLVKLAGIGDALQTTPLLAALRRGFPDAHIAWLSSPWQADVIRNDPDLDELIIFTLPQHTGHNPLSKLAAGTRELMLLRRGRYDLAVIVHRTPDAARLCKLAGIGERVGFIDGSGAALTVKVPYDPTVPEIERNLQLAAALGLEVRADEPMRMVLTAEQERSGAEALSRAGLASGESYVVVAPGGARNPGMELRIKLWRPEGFAAVADRLAEAGRRIVIIGDEGDREHADLMKSFMKSEAIDLTGSTELMTAAAVIEGASLYLGNDSGPLYIAAALTVPTVSVWGPTDPGLLAPRGPAHIAVAGAVDCAPCFTPDRVFTHPKSCDDLKCMDGISAEEVTAAALKAMR